MGLPLAAQLGWVPFDCTPARPCATTKESAAHGTGRARRRVAGLRPDRERHGRAGAPPRCSRPRPAQALFLCSRRLSWQV